MCKRRGTKGVGFEVRPISVQGQEETCEVTVLVASDKGGQQRKVYVQNAKKFIQYMNR